MFFAIASFKRKKMELMGIKHMPKNNLIVSGIWSCAKREIEKSKQEKLKPATSKDFTHFKVIYGPEILRKYTR